MALPDGRQATIHVEEIYSTDPFARCDELTADYGVSVCVVETNPNYNDAHRFAARHPGRVFLAGYGDAIRPARGVSGAEEVTTKRTTMA